MHLTYRETKTEDMSVQAYAKRDHRGIFCLELFQTSYQVFDAPCEQNAPATQPTRVLFVHFADQGSNPLT